MTRVYEFDYRRYFSPSHTVANEIRHSGNGLGNEYFRSTNYVMPKEGEGIVDSVLSLGKTALNFANNNKGLISAIGSVAGAASQISRASETAKQLEALNRIKEIRNATIAAAAPAAPAAAPAAPAAAPKETIQRIRDNFTGRGMHCKKGGILKSF